jgi:hypothetical protein
MERAISAFCAAVQREDGAALAALLALDKSSSAGGADLIRALSGASDGRALQRYMQQVPAPWQPVLVAHLQAAAAAAAGRALDAFSRCLDALNGLNEFASSCGAWIVRPLHTLAYDANAAHAAAGVEAAAVGQREALAELTKAFIATLRVAWANCYNHRVPRDEMESSRKMGALGITNLLFRLYFAIDQPRQCTFYATSVERAGSMPPLSRFPLAQVVTYRYYTGRLALFEERFALADDHLSFALDRCHAGYAANCRRILEACLPVKLRLGRAPPPGLLERYGLQGAWGGIVAGVVQGDLASYRAALSTHAEYFIRAGVYLLLEGLHLIVLRTALKRM